MKRLSCIGLMVVLCGFFVGCPQSEEAEAPSETETQAAMEEMDGALDAGMEEPPAEGASAPQE